MFAKTKEILEDAEALLVGMSPVRSKINVVQKYCAFPIFCLFTGWNDFTRSLRVFLVLLIIISIALFSPISSFTTLSNDLKGITLLLLPLILCLFLVPSSYAMYGLTETNIKKIVDVLDYHDIRRESDIELFESNLERIELRIEGKIKFYNWLIGGSWGLYLIFINYLLRIYSNATPEVLEDVIKESLVPLAIFTLTSLIIVICYKRACNILIASLMYGCTEQKARAKEQSLMKEAQPNSKPCLD